ncbi:hypothetical protein SDC9_198102 [bioreactor metagenome]|uniref:Uncharacterized protein n=1 Tax=bioreactor metagenome TaxID=1076179 RepID=A0A645IGR7_9ZZZZ
MIAGQKTACVIGQLADIGISRYVVLYLIFAFKENAIIAGSAPGSFEGIGRSVRGFYIAVR